MKWLDRIFKLPYYKVKDGRHGQRFNDDEDDDDDGDNYIDNDTGVHSDSNSKQASEDEELDHVIALSLSEEDHRNSNASTGRKSTQAEEDEELARALQASLDMEERSSHPNSGRNSIPIHNASSSRRVCKGCQSEIGHGRFLSCMGALWHPQCFRCYACENPILDLEFSMSENSPYHKSCYKELFHPRCDVCKEFIPMNGFGLIEYRAHPFWGQKYCPSHEFDTTPRCCSCERVEPKDTPYISLSDGRKLCLECLNSSVMDTGECQPLYHDIRDFYEGMNMKIIQQIPMLLVEREALNDAMEGERRGHHHMPETRGLCLSEEQTVNIIYRRPRIGNGSRLMGLRTESQKLARQCEVTAILVLYGLPRLLTGSILAHELMHAWLRLNGYQHLRPEVEEGICQVLGHMWLESEIMAGSSNASSSSRKTKSGISKDEKKLGEFFLHQIAKDSSPIYGEGFRAGHSAMMQYGLRSTLEHIRLTGDFPI